MVSEGSIYPCATPNAKRRIRVNCDASISERSETEVLFAYCEGRTELDGFKARWKDLSAVLIC